MQRDHSKDISALRKRAGATHAPEDPGYNPLESLTCLVAADLLELHDSTGISLDNWASARTLVETLIGHPVTENHV